MKRVSGSFGSVRRFLCSVSNKPPSAYFKQRGEQQQKLAISSTTWIALAKPVAWNPIVS